VSELMAIGVGHAQTVQSVAVSKGIEYVQTSPSAVQVNPAPPGADYGGPYSFSADVDGLQMSALTAPVVSGPFVLGLPGGPDAPSHNNGTLLYNPVDDGWRYGSPSANDWGMQTKAGLDASFPNGSYQFNVGGHVISLDLAGDAYPNAPVLTLTGGVWSGGKYLVDPSQAVTITTSAFAGYGTHVDDAIGLFGPNDAQALQLHSQIPGTNFLSLTIPASSLIAGRDYEVDAAFLALVDVHPDAGLPSSLNAAYYGAGTALTIAAVPEPSAHLLVLIGLAGVFITVLRRR